MKRSLRSWLWRVPIDQEVEEELAFHIEMRRREGKPLEAAEASSACGGPASTSPERGTGRCGSRSGSATLATDVRFAIRQMRASPGFTFVATLTLALGIGANSAIFALADVTLLRPLPFADSGRVVALMERTAAAPQLPLSPPDPARHPRAESELRGAGGDRPWAPGAARW